jgi:malate dehydrogenase
MKIGIIGSGNVGITSAFAIAEKGSGHVLLYGRTPGQAKGKALDLAEASPIRRYDIRIEGTDELDKLMDSDILVVAAGAPRKAGMSRFDLLDQNLDFIHGLAATLRKGITRSEPPVTIMLTEPVDLMTMAFQGCTGWPRERVMGVGGSLSATRLRSFLSRELGLAPTDIDTMVVGTHGDDEVVLERYCRISGLPLTQFLSREQIDDAIAKAKGAGTNIVEQAKRGSSFYTPGAAVGELVQAIAMDSDRVLLASVLLEGEYGIEYRAASVPVKVGAGGVKQIYQLQLTEEEKAAFIGSVNTQQPFIAKVTSCIAE